MPDISDLPKLRATSKPGWMFKRELRDAIREGLKIMTRRIEDKPRYAVGDVLYMKEPLVATGTPGQELYATYQDGGYVEGKNGGTMKWRWFREGLSSMLMPREAARTFLRITQVRRENLQDITASDAIAEGVSKTSAWAPKEVEDRLWDERMFMSVYPQQIAFPRLWDSINTEPGTRWFYNPTVTVYRFEVVQ